jgi:tyrosyl-tRNA synthetase
MLVDNLAWTADVRLLDFLRDVGKHVTVNQMVARESVKARMAGEHGISYTEFSYMLLQASDYDHLYEHERCELQIGGSDQWGNILSGVDLIRRRSGAAVHALCWPLLTAADGTKLGKTTGARVWLDPDKTSPFELFQHFLQVDDREVRRLLLWLTLLPVDEIDAVMADHAQAPQERVAQRLLAREVVGLVHGGGAVADAEKGSSAWTADLDAATLRGLESTLPTTHLAGRALPVPLVDLFVQTDLAASKSAATRLVRQGGAYVNQHKVQHEAAVVDVGDFVEGRWLLLRAGKRQQHLVLRDPSG